MWKTPLGVGVLRQWEWRLFRRGLRSLYNEIDFSAPGSGPIKTGVQVFDQLPDASKLAMLALVGEAVRDASEPCPDTTALSEGTVAAVYRQIRADIHTETIISSDLFPPHFFQVKIRTLVVRAALEVYPECAIPRPHPASPNYDPERLFIPKPDCEDLDVWDKVLDELLGRLIGGSRDFAHAERFPDADPEVSQYLRSQRKIEEGYYTAIAPEPSGRQLASIHKTLCRLCGIPEQGYVAR